jgi:hypothetical protein
LLNIVNNIVADGSSYYGDDLTESQATWPIGAFTL